ncbi:hypothetical protein C8R44DRAFT_876846 [Mycena epipterygia]|nr:hypothetical protein C8R44DRAFT_876846 [Mycena epipterygia]
MLSLRRLRALPVLRLSPTPQKHSPPCALPLFLLLHSLNALPSDGGPLFCSMNCCREGHLTKWCKEPMICRACGGEGTYFLTLTIMHSVTFKLTRLPQGRDCPNPDSERLEALETVPRKWCVSLPLPMLSSIVLLLYIFRCDEECHGFVRDDSLVLSQDHTLKDCPTRPPDTDRASPPHILPVSLASRTQRRRRKTPNVYINGLPPYSREDQLLAITGPFSEVLSVRCFTRRTTKAASGYGFALFRTLVAAEKSIMTLKRSDLYPSFSEVTSCALPTPTSSSSLGSTSDSPCPEKRSYKANGATRTEPMCTSRDSPGARVSVPDPEQPFSEDSRAAKTTTGWNSGYVFTLPQRNIYTHSTPRAFTYLAAAFTTDRW